MIKFHIPGIIQLYDINNILIDMFTNHKEYFYKDISIAGIYGTFIPCPWNGGRLQSDRYQDENERKEIINKYNNLGVGVIYTFTNTSIEPRIYADYICNNDILNICDNNELNKIIIADENLKQYIMNTYSDKNLKFILSTTSDICIDTPILDLEQYEDQYDLIVPRYNWNNTLEMFKVKNPQKYELLLNPQCEEDCKFEKEHYKNISDINSDILTMQDEFKCPYNANNISELGDLMEKRTFINVTDLYDKYAKKGFETFKINGRTAGHNAVISYYMYYMIKPKYAKKALNEFKDYITEDNMNDILGYINNEQSSQ